MMLDDGTLTQEQFNAREPKTPTKEYFEKLLEETLGTLKLKVLSYNWLTYYRVNERRAAEFTHKRRIFLAGDSAHCHSPAGGQGKLSRVMMLCVSFAGNQNVCCPCALSRFLALCIKLTKYARVPFSSYYWLHIRMEQTGMNTGLQDSYNLAWKIALVLNGTAPQSLLDSYNEERIPIADEIIKFSAKTLDNGVYQGWLSSNMKRMMLSIVPFLVRYLPNGRSRPPFSMVRKQHGCIVFCFVFIFFSVMKPCGNAALFNFLFIPIF